MGFEVNCSGASGLGVKSRPYHSPHLKKKISPDYATRAVGAEVRSKPRHCEHVLFMRSNPGERFCAPWIATPAQKSARGLAMTGLRSNFSARTNWHQEMWGMIWARLDPASFPPSTANSKNIHVYPKNFSRLKNQLA